MPVKAIPSSSSNLSQYPVRQTILFQHRCYQCDRKLSSVVHCLRAATSHQHISLSRTTAKIIQYDARLLIAISISTDLRMRFQCSGDNIVRILHCIMVDKVIEIAFVGGVNDLVWGIKAGCTGIYGPGLLRYLQMQG